jgi:hypothetical protein
MSLASRKRLTVPVLRPPGGVRADLASWPAVHRHSVRQAPHRHRRASLALGLPSAVLAVSLILVGTASPAGDPPAPQANAASRRRTPHAAPEARIVWHRSRAIGLPQSGRLAGGVQLPAEGTHFVTWDPVKRTTPNRGWRRYGTHRLVRLILRVAEEYAAAHPDAPRLVVGDLSRPRGGDFGRRFGGDGHRSHQNGLDVDVFYPRRDGLERAPTRVAQIDRRLAQDLVDRFVQAGAQLVFVGPATGLRGPRKVVAALGNHDDHLHARIRPDRSPKAHRRPRQGE